MDVQCSMVTWDGWAWLCTKGPMLNVAPGGLQRLQRITVFGTQPTWAEHHLQLNSRRRKSALHPCCTVMQSNSMLHRAMQRSHEEQCRAIQKLRSEVQKSAGWYIQREMLTMKVYCQTKECNAMLESAILYYLRMQCLQDSAMLRWEGRSCAYVQLSTEQYKESVNCETITQ